MTLLQQYGWTSVHQQFFDLHPQKQLIPGRIISIQGFKYEVISERGPIEAELSGRLLYASDQSELPKVGDWVMLMDYTSIGYIIDMFPRTNILTRKSAGQKVEIQVLATNIDGAMVVQGLDQNFNINRMERYLVQIAACGITPIVILNKADLVEDPMRFKNEVTALGRNCIVHLCSTYTGLGMDELLTNLMQPARTYVLIGSSGVGKSSIVNTVANSDAQRISSTSVSNAKGRHTTTTRNLFLLPNGSLLIDTPGMREFGVTGVVDETADLFPMIDKFASLCKFSDCKHIQENGCAVLEALSTGSLEHSIYENYLKLMKEQRRFDIKVEDKKRLGKQAGKMGREANAHRKKYKF
jgi:ribosome biogenesis GTPase / thiamine phosphate phosphatase